MTDTNSAAIVADRISYLEERVAELQHQADTIYEDMKKDGPSNTHAHLGPLFSSLSKVAAYQRELGALREVLNLVLLSVPRSTT